MNFLMICKTVRGMIARSFLLKTLVWYKYGIKKERSRVFLCETGLQTENWCTFV